MNWLDKSAIRHASFLRHLININERDVIHYAISGSRHLPWIQRQSFAERIHYMWLCLTRNIAITDKHGNVIWEPHESARS